MPTVLLVNGSPHMSGKTHEALALVEDALHEDGVQTEWSWVGNMMVHGCIACEHCARTHRCVFNDDVCNQLIEAMLRCDGMVVGTPVYFAGINGALKALLDRAFYAASAHGRLLAGKPGASVCTLWRGGAVAALDDINRFYTHAGMPIVGANYWPLVFREGDDAYGRRVMATLGHNMAELVGKLAG